MIKKNGLLAMAAVSVAMLFSQCSNNTNTIQNAASGAQGAQNETVSAQNLKIAYVDVDTLLIKYHFCVDLNETMVKKEENMRLTLNEKAVALEKEQQEFQRKYQNNAFLSQDRAQQEYNRLMKMQEDLQKLQNSLANELATETAKNNLQLRDSISNYLKEYNKTKGYNMIISNTGFDNLLYADQSFNITAEIIEGLNARYSKVKK